MSYSFTVSAPRFEGNDDFPSISSRLREGMANNNIEHWWWYRYSVGVWERHANIRGLYIFLENWRVALLRISTDTVRPLMKPHEGLSAQPLFQRSSSSFGESVRRGGGGRSGKENLKVQLAVLRLPMEGDSKMVFEGDSLCSSKVIRGMQVCVVGYLPYMQETEKGERWTRAFFLEAARSKYSSNRSLLPV